MDLPNIFARPLFKVGRALALTAAIVAGSAGAAAAPYAGAVTTQIRVAAPAPVPQRSQLRTPSRDVMLQFHAEFLRAGWEGAQLAAICTGFARAGATVKPTGTQFATLYADLDGDRRPEWVVGAYFPLRAATAPPTSSSMSTRGMVTTRDDRARVVIFRKPFAGPWRIDWISPGLGYEFRAPEYNLREVAEGLGQMEHLRPPLSITDIDGDRRPDIIYQCWSESPVVGALPGIY
ncbi:MAG: hypothetical protein ACO1SX_18500, partial [Actinomycetota bacterium]